jgi:excisionase family DNA binding protein
MKQLEKILGMNRLTINMEIEAGKLKYKTMGKRRRFTQQHIDEYLEKCESK